MRTRLHARYVLGHHEGDHVIHRDASVVYEDDRIVHVGPSYDGQVDESIDLGNSFIVPGLIDLDAVADLDHIILDCWGDPELRKGHQWSEDYFTNRRQDVFTQEERRLIRKFAMAELILHGVTTAMPIASEVHSSWAETYQDFVDMSEEALELGLRVYLGPSYRGGVHVTRQDGTPDVMWSAAEGEEGLDGARRFAEHAAGLPDLIQPVFAPCRIETMTRELLEKTHELATALDVRVRLHCMQSMRELQLIDAAHGMTPMDLLEEIGMMNERLLVPHAKYMSLESAGRPTDDELRRFASSGASVVHTPLTEARLGYVIDSFDRYVDAGVPMAFGSDCFPPDLIRGMELSSNLAKIMESSFDAGSPADLLRSATTGGADALGRPDLGRLQPGAQADLTVFSFDHPAVGLIEDPVRTLLMHATARDVTMTVVAGRTVMRDGVIPGLDLDALRREAQELFDRMKSRYPERDVHGRDVDTLFPPTFPSAPLS
ncbi:MULTISPECIES: chlorohydrolase family protein [Arthrobacter]|uniref:Chlorohydrolase family protein n=2 Tax=Arthrobacter TaxID=1663 RepID=A0ABU9KQ47_9MICC|nr:chlorohydrolase family protein [Arthrobacter sp. YJM1]MDP5227638.1 chlorohydrolase family protein [Arthrobacter sp. YJM1]